MGSLLGPFLVSVILSHHDVLAQEVLVVRSLKKTSSLALALLLASMILPRFVRAQQTPPSNPTLIPIDDSFDDQDDFEGVKGLDLRSQGRQVGQSVLKAAATGNLIILSGSVTPNGNFSRGDSKHDSQGPNVQVNDPATDTIQSFTGTRPFEESTQSETSIAVAGNDIVVGYNSSAGEPIVKIGNSLFATHIFFSGFSVSHDGGATWKSGFIPPPPRSIETLGDPSVGVDRAGNFYYTSLAADAAFNLVIAVNKSTDHGTTFAPAVIAATDNGADKDWMAVGPDPAVPGRDNIYVTWTSFRSNRSSQLWFARSTDGGATWTSKAIFAPVSSGVMSNQLSFSNPVVDASNGRLYIPFLHFSFIDADDIRVLASDDAGETFHFLTFNAPGAPDAFAFPNVTPGELIDCGGGGLRNVLHQGADVGGGRFGLARYVHATRLITQPAAVAGKGRLFLALQTSTSPFFGDPAAGSEINLLYSPDGGTTWEPSFKVAASTLSEPQHVHPAIALTEDKEHVSVGYYVQQDDTKLRTDLASIKVDNDFLRLKELNHLSTASFDLTPSNIPFPLPGRPFNTTNYDRTVVPCYNIGEYMSVTSSHADVLAAWGDNRQSWTGPVTSPAPGVHVQADVVFGRGQN